MPKTTASPTARQGIGANLPPSANFTSKPAAPASKPDRKGGLVASQRSAQVIPVPCLEQAAIGMMSSVIADEYPRATPLGPWLRPNTIPTITSGVVAVLILNAYREAVLLLPVSDPIRFHRKYNCTAYLTPCGSLLPYA